MKPIDLIGSDFEKTVGRPGIVLVDFWAPWCAPCRAFGPIFEKAAETHPEMTFAKVNTEDQGDLEGMLGISSIPTLMIFRDGVLLYSQPGLVPGPALEDLIRRVGAVDMAEVRRKMSEQEEREPAAATA